MGGKLGVEVRVTTHSHAMAAPSASALLLFGVVDGNQVEHLRLPTCRDPSNIVLLLTCLGRARRADGSQVDQIESAAPTFYEFSGF